MARPSKKAERLEEILDAYERCVVSFGVEGATLQRIADEAGLARPLLHHYVGNREDLLQALIERFLERGEVEDAQFLAALPETGRCAAYVELLFDPRYASSSHEILLFQALMVAAQQRPALRRQLLSWHEAFVDDLFGELQAEHPQVKPDELRSVALGIVALYFNADALSPLLSTSAMFDESKLAATRLLKTLE